MYPLLSYWHEQEALLNTLIRETVELLLSAFFISLVAGSLLGLLLAGLRIAENPLLRWIANILRFIVMLIGDYPFIILFVFIISLSYYGNMLPFHQLLQLLLMGWGTCYLAYNMLQNRIDRAEEEGFAVQFIRSIRQLAISLISAIAVASIIARIGIGNLLYEGFYQEDFIRFLMGAILFAVMIIGIELIFAIILLKVRQNLRRQVQKMQTDQISYAESSVAAQESELSNNELPNVEQLEDNADIMRSKRTLSSTSSMSANNDNHPQRSTNSKRHQSSIEDPFSGLIQ